MAVEYPGYSFYKGEPSQEQVYEDVDLIINFVQVVLEVPLKNIIVIGRSLGSGPATYMASKYQVAMLVLISPFMSIKEVVKDTFGYLGSLVIKEYFENIKAIRSVKSQVLIIHGKLDDVVLPHHSKELQSIFFQK